MRETPKARREREAYEAAIAAQRAQARYCDCTLPAGHEGPCNNKLAPPPAAPAAHLARASDVETSHEAVPSAERRRTQKAAILVQHGEHREGLIDDEVNALLGEDLHRRCSELRNDGLLAWKLDAEGRPVKREARSGKQVRVSVLGPRA